MPHALFDQLANIRETLASPIPDLPQNLFLRCDGCAAPMRSETSFLCRSCLRTHGIMSPEGERLIARGMEQVDEMYDAVGAARVSGRWT
jgi:hypothetical protein